MWTVNVILLYSNHRNQSVFDKSTDEKISEMSYDEYAVRTKQEKLGGGGTRVEINKN